MEETKEREVEIHLQDLLVVFAKVWWILLLIGIVVCGSVYGFMKVTHVDEYTATATVYINRPSGTLQASQVSISNALVGDYIELVTMGETLETVRNTLGIDAKELPNKKFEKMITVSNSTDTRWIQISVTAEDAQNAVDLANELADQSVHAFNYDLLGGETYSKYYGKVDTTNPINSTKITNPISLTKILLIGIGACLLAYLVFFMLYIMDDKINTPEDIEKYLKLNLLGQIPYRHSNHGKRYVAEGADKKGEKA